MSHPGNHILEKEASFSSNFYISDGILNQYLRKYTSPDSLNYMSQKLNILGEKAATVMDILSLEADTFGPELINRSPYGENLDHIRFHPSYWLLPGQVRWKKEPGDFPCSSLKNIWRMV